MKLEEISVLCFCTHVLFSTSSPSEGSDKVLFPTAQLGEQGMRRRRRGAAGGHGLHLPCLSGTALLGDFDKLQQTIDKAKVGSKNQRDINGLALCCAPADSI